MAVNGLDSVIGQSLSGLSTSAGGAGGVSGSVLGMPTSARSSSVNSYDNVTLSRNVPRPIEASTMELSSTISGKLAEGYTLTRKEKSAIQESRVLAALTGMQLLADDASSAQKVWLGGLPRPTSEELDEAYKRLTQKLSNPTESRDFETTNQVRIELLDQLRNTDFRSTPITAKPQKATPVSTSETATTETASAETTDTASSATTAAPTNPIRLVA